MLSRRILRDNFKDVRSSFVQRLFHRVLQGEGRGRTAAACPVQFKPNDAITHADQLAVSAMRLEIGPHRLKTADHPGFYIVGMERVQQEHAGYKVVLERRGQYPFAFRCFQTACRSIVAVRRRAAQLPTEPAPARRPELPGRRTGQVWLPAFLRVHFGRGTLRAAA